MLDLARVSLPRQDFNHHGGCIKVVRFSKPHPCYCCRSRYSHQVISGLLGHVEPSRCSRHDSLYQLCLRSLVLDNLVSQNVQFASPHSRPKGKTQNPHDTVLVRPSQKQLSQSLTNRCTFQALISVAHKSLIVKGRPSGDLFFDLATEYPDQDLLSLNFLRNQIAVMSPRLMSDLLVNKCYDFAKPQD